MRAEASATLTNAHLASFGKSGTTRTFCLYRPLQSPEGGDLIVLPLNKVQLAFPPMYTDSDGTKRCTYNDRIDTSNGRPENVSFTLPSSSGWFGTLYAPWCGGYVMIYGNTQASNASLVDKMNVVQCNSYSLTMYVPSSSFLSSG
jgi:hypothetical protein